MITQTVHEIHNPFDAFARELGECLVLFLITGSVTSNPQFIVRFYHSGDLRTVDQNDLKVYGNPTAGEKLVPEIPKDWWPRNKEMADHVDRIPPGARRNMGFLQGNDT